MKVFLYIIIFCCTGNSGFSQKMDTVVIDPSKVNTKVLKPGVHRWLVYFKNGEDSSRTNFNLWTRSIDFITFKGRDAISVTQEWEDNTSITHKVYSVCDRKTFAPLYQDSWWKNRGSNVFDFVEKTGSLRDTLLSDADTVRMKKNMYAAFKQALNQYVLNWHLDLETFPLLPYKNNTTFLINFYEAGSVPPKQQAYTVTGSGTLTGLNNEPIDCWLLTHTSPNNKEVFWVSKKSKEVLKLEQQIGSRFRYKVKLGFAS
jgi:hypothetical protein